MCDWLDILNQILRWLVITESAALMSKTMYYCLLVCIRAQGRWLLCCGIKVTCTLEPLDMRRCLVLYLFIHSLFHFLCNIFSQIYHIYIIKCMLSYRLLIQILLVKSHELFRTVTKKIVLSQSSFMPQRFLEI